MRKLKVFSRKVFARMLIQGIRVADIELLMKCDGGHRCWEIFDLRSIICPKVGVVTTPLNNHKISAIWV